MNRQEAKLQLILYFSELQQRGWESCFQSLLTDLSLQRIRPNQENPVLGPSNSQDIEVFNRLFDTYKPAIIDFVGLENIKSGKSSRALGLSIKKNGADILLEELAEELDKWGIYTKEDKEMDAFWDKSAGKYAKAISKESLPLEVEMQLEKFDEILESIALELERLKLKPKEAEQLTQSLRLYFLTKHDQITPEVVTSQIEFALRLKPDTGLADIVFPN